MRNSRRWLARFPVTPAGLWTTCSPLCRALTGPESPQSSSFRDSKNIPVFVRRGNQTTASFSQRIIRGGQNIKLLQIRETSCEFGFATVGDPDEPSGPAEEHALKEIEKQLQQLRLRSGQY